MIENNQFHLSEYKKTASSGSRHCLLFLLPFRFASPAQADLPLGPLGRFLRTSFIYSGAQASKLGT